MYYVTKGNKQYFVARGPKDFIKELEDHDDMLDICTFDYDNKSVWPDDALKAERQCVVDDPYAITALDAELDRRFNDDKTFQAPWFDDAAAMIADLSMALEQEDLLFAEDDEDDEDEWDDDEEIWDSLDVPMSVNMDISCTQPEVPFVCIEPVICAVLHISQLVG